MKILVVEDEPSLRDIIRRTLEGERYVVECAADYPSALRKLDDYEYDCILLDIMLPGGSGLGLLEHLRKERRAGSVIIISAKDSVEDKVSGLNLGADDYLPKPFHLAELTARVQSVLRRGRRGSQSEIKAGNITLVPEKFQIFVGDSETELLRKEYEILSYFLMRPGHVVDKQTLAEAVWGDHADQADNFFFVYAQVKNLRKKLRDAGATPEIRSVYGFGYKLVVPED